MGWENLTEVYVLSRVHESAPEDDVEENKKDCRPFAGVAGAIHVETLHQRLQYKTKSDTSSANQEECSTSESVKI
jgi:hypothetical protein